MTGTKSHDPQRSPERTYESKTLSSLPGNLTQYWVVAAFENRENPPGLGSIANNLAQLGLGRTLVGM
jgi:hypothetical protein